MCPKSNVRLKLVWRGGISPHMSGRLPQAPGVNAASEPLRRRLLKVFFFGSMAAAGAALTYRLGQWSRSWQQTPDPTVQAKQVTVAVYQALEQLPTATSQPKVKPTASAPPPQATANPALGETELPYVRPTTPASPVLRVPVPPIISQREWGGRAPTKGFLPQRPSRITLHHEGVFFDGSIPAPAYLKRLQIWSIDKQGWPDIPYHYLIDLKGLIYQGRPLEARGDTNTSYNLQDHALVALLGKYDSGEQEPNKTQIDTIIWLMAWIADAYNIPADMIYGHRDFIPINEKGEHIDPNTRERITCPGDNLYRYLADGTLQRGVELLLQQTYTTETPEDSFGERL